MKLEYHNGQNFGDALNPYIFNFYLPNFFDEDDNIIFVGIGSILGLKKPRENQKIIIFSSGYADGAPKTYGYKPILTTEYNILCVRGPLTANILNIAPEKAVADGAILIKELPIVKNLPQKITGKIGFIPHVGSPTFYNWSKLCKQLELAYIDPSDDVEKVLQEMASCERIITEAMHGAIIADVLRIPFLPIKCYSTINEFKWKDYCSSMGLCYAPFKFLPMFSFLTLRGILESKFKSRFLSNIFSSIYYTFQCLIVHKINLFKLKQIQTNSNKFKNSNIDMLNQKHDQLLNILLEFRKSYKKATKIFS